MSQTRMTKQRAIILEELRGVTSHPTADEIYGMVRRRLPKISLGTVYRNLDLLSGTESIRKLERAGMQMRFDGNMAPHQHVRCEVCGVVGDVFSPVDVSLPATGAVPGFHIHTAEVEFLGICDACRAKKR